MNDSTIPTLNALDGFQAGPPVPPSLPRWVPIALLAAVPLWAAAMYGTLQIHQSEKLATWLGSGVCGPWGCAAKPEALLGYHSFWLTLLGPLGLVVGLRIEPSIGRVVWASLLTLGVLLTAGIIGWAIYDCLVTGPEHLHQYWLQIAGFRLATSTDLPCVPIALAGLTCWLGLRIQKAWLTPLAPGNTSASSLDALGGLVEQSPAAVGGSQGTL